MVKHISLLNARIAERYAKSLFALAHESDSVMLIEKQLDTINTLLTQNEALARIIKSPIATKDKLYKLVQVLSDKVFKTENSSTIINNFLNLLVKNNRLNIFSAIYENFQKILLENRNELKVKVVSAFPFREEEKKELSSVLQNFVNKNILLTTCVDKSIIGGFIVSFGSYQIDESIATKLNSLKIALKEVS